MQAILRPSSIAARFGSDALWSTAGNVVTQGLSFCSMLIIARLLAKEEFGEYVVFLSSVGLLGTLAGLGLGVAVTTSTAELRDSAPSDLGRRLSAAYSIAALLTACLGACLVLFGIVVGNKVINVRLEPLYLGLAVGTLGVNVAFNLQAAELAGTQSFRSLALAQSVRGLALPPLCATGAIFFGLPGVLAAVLTATGVGALVQATSLSIERRRRGIALRRPGSGHLCAVLSCSIPAFVGAVSQAAGYWGGTVTVAALAPRGMAIVAEYGAASQISAMILFLPNIIGQILMPTVANRKATDPRESRRLVRFSIMLNTGAAVLLAVAILALRHEIARLFGSTYAQAAGTVGLIGIGAVLYVAQSTISYALIGYGYVRWSALASVLGAATFVITAYVLTLTSPNIGSKSLGCAYLVSSTVQLAINSGRLLRLIGSPPRLVQVSVEAA